MSKKIVKKTEKEQRYTFEKKKMGNMYINAYFIKNFYKDVPIPIFCGIMESVKAVRFAELLWKPCQAAMQICKSTVRLGKA